MAQRKSPPSGKAASGKTPAGRTAAKAVNKNASAKVGTSKPVTKPGSDAPSTEPPVKSAAAKAPAKNAASIAAARRAANKGPATRPPARRSKGKPKSIVNQKQTPWGLIVSTVVVVIFAVAVVIVVVSTHKSKTDGQATSTTAGGQSVKASDPYRQPELAAAKKIAGVTYTVEAQHNHEEGHIKYAQSPPIGGNHNGFWADCTGTIYPKAIASENAVHMLEHGGIWVTYNAKDIGGSKLTELEKYVKGVDFTAMSPYPNLKSPISLQAWGYQLFVNSPTDPRIAQFIATLKLNKATTPEFGATCSQPAFKSNPSTYGHPTDS